MNQLDGFDYLGKTKVIFATNRPDTLDPALLRPGRVDRKIEIPLPNEVARMEILKIHAAPIRKAGEIDYEAVVKLSEGFNGAGQSVLNRLHVQHVCSRSLATLRRFEERLH